MTYESFAAERKKKFNEEFYDRFGTDTILEQQVKDFLPESDKELLKMVMGEIKKEAFEMEEDERREGYNRAIDDILSLLQSMIDSDGK